MKSQTLQMKQLCCFDVASDEMFKPKFSGVNGTLARNLYLPKTFSIYINFIIFNCVCERETYFLFVYNGKKKIIMKIKSYSESDHLNTLIH